MIDTKELRQSLGAVQPEEVAELLDRLEEAEKERDWNAERLEDAIEECTALRAKIEAMEKQGPVEWQTRTRPAWDVGDVAQVQRGVRGRHQKDALASRLALRGRALYAPPRCKILIACA